jgi:general stress protein YciG
MTKRTKTMIKPKGTAAMDPETRVKIARAGGLAVSRDKGHMATIGRKGGINVSRDREYMAAIGRKGGSAPHARAEQRQP